MQLIAQWISIVTALAAAVFWFWSASVHIPNIMQTQLQGPGSITDILRWQARLSALGAVFAAISALALAVYQWFAG